MPKDGTSRGGSRAGAVRKPKALVDKINQGTAASVLSSPEPVEMNVEKIHPVKKFLKVSQKSGVNLCAEFLTGMIRKYGKEVLA